MSKRTSRREEITRLRADLRAKGASYRHIAQVITQSQNANVLLAYRLAHGMTQQQVADAWNDRWSDKFISHKHISYWESWPGPTGRPPSLEALNRLAQIYQCRAADLIEGEDHSTLGPASSQPVPTIPIVVSETSREVEVHADSTDVVGRVDTLIANSGPLLTSRETDYKKLVNDLTEWAFRMKRRDILQWISWAASAAAAAPVLQSLDDEERERVALALISPRRVDGKVIDHIEAVLWRCMRQDDSLGPQAALDTTLAQRNLVRSLLDEVSGPHQDRLISLYANLSRFCGWLSFDLNNYDAASEYYETARSAAHDAHNTELGAFVLCNMSHLATWRGRPRVGIDHAVAAQGWANQTEDLRLQAYACDVAARAFSADQQSKPAFYAIDQAKQSIGRVKDAPKGHVYFYSVGQLAHTESLCHLRLGSAERGVEIAQSALKLIDSSFVRNLAMTQLLLSACHLAEEKPRVDEATKAVVKANRLAVHNRSARLAQRLDRSWKALEPWRDTESVQAARRELEA